MDFAARPETREEFAGTVADLEAGKLYVHCPDCRGHQQVYLYRQVNDAGSGSYFNCPTCSATGEAEAEKAIDFMRAWQELHDDEFDAERDLSVFEAGEGLGARHG